MLIRQSEVKTIDLNMEGSKQKHKKASKIFLQIISSLLDHVTSLKSQINLYLCILYD